MHPGHILFIIPYSISQEPVLQTQVLGPITSLSQDKYVFSLLCWELEYPTSPQYMKALAKYEVGVFRNTSSSLAARIPSMILQAREIIKEYKPNYIYFRDVWGGIIAFFTKTQNTQVVYDLRGVIAEESLYRNNRKFPNYFLLKILEKLLMRTSDKILCVSTPLKEYIRRSSPSKPIGVIPSCINMDDIYFDCNARELTREALSIAEDEILFVYLGGVAKWQMLNETIVLFGRVRQEKRNARFLILTKDVAKTYRAIQNHGHGVSEDIIVRTVPHNDVYKYLSAGDIGLLLREKILVNRVASPVKFAEYLACGLPVIITPEVGDCSQIVQDEQVGVVTALGDHAENLVMSFLELYEGNRMRIKERCIKVAEQRLTWKQYLGVYREIYGVGVDP